MTLQNGSGSSEEIEILGQQSYPWHAGQDNMCELRYKKSYTGGRGSAEVTCWVHL